MEKLIELLNEHRKEMNGDGKWYTDTDNYNMLTLNNLDKLSSELWAISKEYGFIKWLVDNDKIKREGIEYACYIKTKDNVIHSDDISKEGVLLMLLSIQDEPIDFLIEILK